MLKTAEKLLLGVGAVAGAVALSRVGRSRTHRQLGSAPEPLMLSAGSFTPEERTLLVGALRESRGRTRKAARMLGAGYRTTLRRMHEAGLPVRRGRPRTRFQARTRWWPW